MRNLICLFWMSVISGPAVHAQGAELHTPQPEDSFSFHERASETAYDRYETPRRLVHRNAALQAAQRRERMGINARFGYSPSRPPASTVPFMGSPTTTALRLYYAPYPGTVFPRYYRPF